MLLELKNPSSNWERNLLAIIDKEKENIAFGRIKIELVVTNGKVTLVELEGVKKTFKMDS